MGIILYSPLVEGPVPFIKGQYMAHQSAVNEMLQPVLSNRTIGLNLQEETTAAVIILLDVMSLDADTSLQALTEMRTVVVSHQTRVDIVDDSSLREWIETNIGAATHRSPTPEMSIAVISRRLGIDVVSNPRTVLTGMAVLNLSRRRSCTCCEKWTRGWTT